MPSRPSTMRWFVARWSVAAVLVGLLLRVIFILHHPRWVGDTQVYGDLAENMLMHHIFGFSQSDLQPTLIRLPGYPIFLAACFILFGHANYLAVVCVQVALDLLGCILLAILATRIFSPRVGLITLWLAALCPFTANYAAAVLTETLSIFCVTVALFALERWQAQFTRTPQTLGAPSSPTASSQAKVGSQDTSAARDSLALGWSFLIGAACSFAVLVRPDQGLLGAAVIPAMLWITFKTPSRSLRSRLLPVAVASFVVMLPLLLWGVRNWRVFHVIQPLAPRYANDPGETIPFGFQRWFRTWGIDFQSTYDTYWAYDGAPIDIRYLPARAFDSPQQRAATADLLARYNINQSETPFFDAAFAQLAAARVAAHPIRYYLVLPIARVADMWLRPRTELLPIPIAWWLFTKPTASLFSIFFALLDAAYLALAVIGLIRCRRTLWSTQPALLIAMVGFVALRCALLLTLDNSEPRYTLECFPVVILLASAAFNVPHPRNVISTEGRRP
jgi:4-amino-4-deoxy-L-arabinose transferase-like glycosyltransferase